MLYPSALEISIVYNMQYKSTSLLFLLYCGYWKTSSIFEVNKSVCTNFGNNVLQDLLKKIQQFQEDVQQEVSAELMDVSRLETLLEEFTAPPDIDIPELTVLRKVTASV